jgi:trehalose 6-phosphate synthase
MSPKSQEWKLDAASFVVVANRLPVEQIDLPDGSTDWHPSPGGLVTAFDPIMHSRRGAWIGWHGAADEELEPFEDDGLTLVPVPLSASDVAEYYEGFSNGTLWPLYHDAIATPQFHREWWDTYVSVNQRFADRTAKVAARGAVVWVQDYQLQLVPRMLRRLRPDVRIGFFLHIPFPPTELFLQLPWRE